MNENIKIAIQGLVEEKKIYAEKIENLDSYKRKDALERIKAIDVEIKNIFKDFEIKTTEEVVAKIKTIIKDQDEKYIVNANFNGEDVEREFLFEPSDLKNNILEDIENLIEKKNEK